MFFIWATVSKGHWQFNPLVVENKKWKHYNVEEDKSPFYKG